MTVTATGPYTVSGYDGYTFYKFTGAGSTTWSVPSDCSSVDVTVVGGGGAPYSRYGSGSGYMVSRFNQSVSGEVTIIVDGGATASLSDPVNGGSSSFGSISADGGHGNDNGFGGNGGSGGGGADGGAGGSNGSYGCGANPGVGQGIGSTANNPAPCSGTTGIDGVLRCGGGGGAPKSNPPGAGGAGGGGAGNCSGAGESGVDDYGGGGGARYNLVNLGGNGGSGIVIVKYIPKVSKKKGQPQINSGGLLIV